MAATKKTTTAKAVKPAAKKAAPAKKVPAKKAAAPAKKAVPAKTASTGGEGTYKPVALQEGWYSRGYKPEPFTTPVLPAAAQREPETRCHGFVLASVKARFEQRVKAAYTTQAIVLTQHIHQWLRGKIQPKIAESPRRSGVVGDDLARISVDIPTVLQRKFKAECAERGLTVTQVLGALVADWTQHYKNYV